MPNEFLAMLPVVGFLLGIVGWTWFHRSRREPCPYCGRRSGRLLAEHRLGPDGLRPQALIYQCRTCRGALRYARRPTGQEYWEQVDESIDRRAAEE